MQEIEDIEKCSEYFFQKIVKFYESLKRILRKSFCSKIESQFEFSFRD